MPTVFKIKFTLLLFLFTASLCAVVVVVNGESNHNHYPYPASVKNDHYEALRTCLLSWGIPRTQIIGRDNPLDNELYLDLNWQWNTLYGTISPLAYLHARSAQDVAAGVKCATQLGVRVVAKSGGHSYLKHGFGDADSLIVDLQLLNDVTVDVDEKAGAGETVATATATIGAGARQGRILADLWAAGGWLLPAGGCPTVGLAGYVLGGGYGTYSRWVGLALDLLLEVTMIDAAGEIVTVNNVTDPDLFWALRGGGGGNFGIVTSMRLQLRRAPDQVVVIRVQHTWNQFPAWIRAWQEWVFSQSPAHLMAAPALDEFGIITRFTSMNGTLEELQHVIYTQFPPPSANISSDVFTFPDFVVFRAQGYWPSTSPEPLTNISQLVNLTRHNQPGWKRVKSFFVNRKLTSQADIARLQGLFLDYVQYSDTAFEQWGGVISDVNPSDTAYVHRASALYSVQPRVYAEDGNEPAEVVNAMERFFEGTKAVWNHTASYQNYLDQELPDYLQRYYGANLERLVAVKTRVDPNDVFHHSRSIPVHLPN